MDYLTKRQLQRFIGYSQISKQIRWLQENGIRHYVGGDGELRVLRCYVGEMCPSCRPSRDRGK